MLTQNLILLNINFLVPFQYLCWSFKVLTNLTNPINYSFLFLTFQFNSPFWVVGFIILNVLDYIPIYDFSQEILFFYQKFRNFLEKSFFSSANFTSFSLFKKQITKFSISQSWGKKKERKKPMASRLLCYLHN